MSSEEIRRYMNIFEAKEPVSPTLGNRLDSVIAAAKDNNQLHKAMKVVLILFGTSASLWLAATAAAIMLSIVTGLFHLVFAIIGAILTAILLVVMMPVSAVIGMSIGKWLVDRDTRIDETEDEDLTQYDRIKTIHDEIMDSTVPLGDTVIEIYERVKSGEISEEDWKILRKLFLEDFKNKFKEKFRMIMQELKEGRLTKAELETIYVRVKNVPLVREIQNALTPKLKSQKTTVQDM